MGQTREHDIRRFETGENAQRIERRRLEQQRDIDGHETRLGERTPKSSAISDLQPWTRAETAVELHTREPNALPR